MKTHELARALRLVAKVLENGQNVELTESWLSAAGRRMDTSTMALSLSVLTDLARIDKRQWLSFVQENSLDIDARPRDGSRDILDKVLRHLMENSEARERLRERVARRSSQASPELMKAFAFLLGDTHEGPTGRD